MLDKWLVKLVMTSGENVIGESLKISMDKLT